MPKFPFTNYHELNLDWILKKVTALFDASEENARTIRTYETRLTDAEQTATSAATAATAAQQLADAASENADSALSVAGTADSKADSALTAATNAADAVAGALTIAQEAQQTAGAAVATANDAAATASSLESLANTANQNATAALETAQTADQKAVAAQSAAATADQKAVAAQTAATTNAGNISTLQTDVSNLNRQISDVEENQIPELKSAIDELSAEKISKEKIGGIWKEFVFPPAFLGTFKPVKLFTDGKFWKTDFNKEDWKVTASGAKTYYVDPSGTYLNDGLSPDKPVPMYNAINRSSAGDTIIVAEGDYRKDTVTNAAIPSITKSLNIIGKGNVRISKSGVKTPAFDSETGLYTVTQAAIQGVYDPDLDMYYTVADTLADCQATANSVYYGNAPTVYINMTYQHDIIAVYNDVMFVVDNSAADVQVYVENIEFMGGGCCFQTNTTNAHSCLVVFEKCRFTYNVGASNNVVKIASAKAIFHKCIARYSRNDGFAYTVTENGAETGFVEIDCEAYNNGFNHSSDSSNGSTAHSGICGIRVNGIYHGSKGGNVVDVQTGTQTINCGCSAFNSVATQDGYNEGFGIQQAGATQWLYNCVAFGNFYDFYGVPSSEQIAFRSSHIKDNYSFDYSGNLTDTQPKTLAEINFENSAKISQQL